MDRLKERKPVINNLIKEIGNFILDKFKEAKTENHLEEAMVLVGVEDIFKKNEGLKNGLKILRGEPIKEVEEAKGEVNEEMEHESMFR